MNRLKLLSLILAAAALLIAIGAMTAHATVLCKNGTTTTGCTETYKAGTILTAKLEGTSELETTGGTTYYTCKGGSLKAEVTSAESSPLLASDTELTFSECGALVTTIAPGTLKVEHKAGSDNGTVTMVGSQVTHSQLGTMHLWDRRRYGPWNPRRR